MPEPKSPETLFQRDTTQTRTLGKSPTTLFQVDTTEKELPSILQRKPGEGISKVEHAGRAFIQESVQALGRTAKMASLVSTGAVNKTAKFFGLGNNVADPKNDLLYIWADRMGQWIEEAFPGNPELQGNFLVDQLPRAAANLAQQVALGGLYRPLAIVQASGFASTEYEQALKAHGDEEKAFQTFLYNLPVAGVSSLGAMAFLRRLDKFTGGGVKKVLKKGFRGGLEEMTDEVAAQWGTNVIAKNTYDETRSLLNGLKEGAGAGFVLGFALNSIGLSLHHRANDPSLTKQERANVKEAQKLVDKELAETNPEDLNFIDRRIYERQLAQRKVVKNPTDAESAPGEMNQTNSGAMTIPYMESRNNAARALRKYLLPEGLFAKPMFRFLQRRDGAIERHAEIVTQQTRALNTSVLEAYAPDRVSLIGRIQNIFSPPDISQKIIDTMNRTLEGEIKGKNLDPKVRENIYKLRDHMDNLTRDLIKEGVIPESWAPSAEKNIGFYLHRVYRAHIDPKWKKKIPQDVRNRAEAFLKDYLEHHSAVTGKKLKRKRKITQQEVDREINRILDGDEINPGLFFRNKALDHEASTDLSPFMQRQNIPQPIRALLGEIRDPIVNYSITVQKMSAALENRRMLKDAADKFTGVYFFKKGDRNAPENASVRISAKGNETLKPLDGMYTTRDMKDALYKAYHPDRVGKAAQIYMRIAAVPKYSKTVLNQVTHARNVVGGAEFVLRNGIIPNSSEFRTAFEVAAGTFQNRGAEWDTRRQRMAELNLVKKSIRAGEIYDVSRDINLESADLMGTSLHHFGKHASGFRKSASRFLKVATDVYQAEDDFLRVLFFEAELRRQRKADPNVSEEFVAGLIKDTYQDYSQLPTGVKFMRRSPVNAPFTAFPYEVIRTNINTTKHGLREIRSSNPELRRIGYTRLASQSASLTVAAAAGVATRAMIGMGVEEEEDYRRFMAPWDKFSTAAWVDADRGESRYINLSYTHPQQYLTDPILTFMGRGDEDELERQMLNGFKEMFAPILGEELLFAALRDINRNEKSTGARVYNPEDDVSRRVADQFSHLWDSFEPGVLSSIKRTHEALYDDYSNKEASDELIALFGLRITRLNVKESLPFKVRDYRDRVSNARSQYTTIRARPQSSDEEKLRAFQAANESYKEIFEEMVEDIRAARRLGLSTYIIEAQLKDAGMSGAEIQRIQRNQFSGFKP